MNGNPTQPLKARLNRWDSMAIIIGIVIGVGIFRVADEVLKFVQSPWIILLVWLVGGLISLLGALCYAELSSAFPRTGGNYVYLKESYGPWAGFLYGWAELLVIHTGSIAAVAFILAESVQSFLNLHPVWVKPTAVLAVMVLSGINIFSVQYGKNVQNFFSAVKVIALIVLVVCGFLSQKGDLNHFFVEPGAFEGNIFAMFGLALIPILWTYGGWHENTFVAGETKEAGKTLPFALIAGILLITFLYMAVQCFYIYLIPSAQDATGSLVATRALHILYGSNGQKLFEVLVILFSLGGINACIMTGSRITYAMAKDHAVFRYLGEIHPKFQTPCRSIVINGIWTVILIISGAFHQLLFFTGVIVWIVFAAAVAGLFILRRKYRDLKAPYRVWGYPVLPLVFLAICIALVINTAVFYPWESLMGVLLTATGIPVYLFSRRMCINK